MFSVGILYRVQELLEIASNYEASSPDFQKDFKRFADTSIEYVIEEGKAGGWIHEPGPGQIRVTDRGLRVLATTSPRERLRVQIKDLLLTAHPSWTGLVSRGRDAVRNFAEPNVVQCFREAGLLDGLDTPTALWWDEIISLFRSDEFLRRTETGRKGELLSFNYELQRTGVLPLWVALDDPYSPYDVLSRVDRDDERRLVIEVKASIQSIETANFYITRAEWTSLSTAGAAVLHLWALNKMPPLLEVWSIDKLSLHIPTDMGTGQWQTVLVPFRSDMLS